MTAAEQRVAELIDDPWRDELREADIPLIKGGYLFLNWTTLSSGEWVHPFVTAAPVACRYLTKNGKIGKREARLLKSYTEPKRIAEVLKWAEPLIEYHNRKTNEPT